MVNLNDSLGCLTGSCAEMDLYFNIEIKYNVFGHKIIIIIYFVLEF